MNTLIPSLIELDDSIPCHISEAAVRLRNDKQMYDDIKEGDTVDYFDALEKFSAQFLTISSQQFEEIRSRRGLIDEDCKQQSPFKLVTI